MLALIIEVRGASRWARLKGLKFNNDCKLYLIYVIYYLISIFKIFNIIDLSNDPDPPIIKIFLIIFRRLILIILKINIRL